MGFYDKIGVRRVINANGTKTHLGGTIPDHKVMDSMKEASQSFIIMMELIEKASNVLAKVTEADAGLVTAGSFAGMIHAANACILKDSNLDKFDIKPIERINFDEDWLDIMQKYPDHNWTQNEILTMKMHRHAFDHAYKVGGGKIVEVGTEDGCLSEKLEAAINERTAAINFTARVDNTPEKAGKNVPLNKVVEIAHGHDLPVIVDAASELPPRSNLKKYIAEGADLVIYSGGKHIGGPNDTGILVGQRELIKLATLQAAPYRGIGRGMKVDRSQIVGLLTALRIWLEKDEKAEYEEWMKKVQWMTEVLNGIPEILKSEIYVQPLRNRCFTILTLESDTAQKLVLKLRKQNPSIWVGLKGLNKIEINPSNLKDGEEKKVASAIKKILLK